MLVSPCATAARVAPQPGTTSPQRAHHGAMLFIKCCRFATVHDITHAIFLSFGITALFLLMIFWPLAQTSRLLLFLFPLLFILLLPAHPSIVQHSPAVASICTFALPLIFSPNEPTIVSPVHSMMFVMYEILALKVAVQCDAKLIFTESHYVVNLTRSLLLLLSSTTHPCPWPLLATAMMGY